MTDRGFTHSRCDECGDMRDRCPDCGGTKVSVDQADPAARRDSVGVNFTLFATIHDPGRDAATLDYRLVCWECGWREDRRLTMDVRRIEHGTDEYSGGDDA